MQPIARPNGPSGEERNFRLLDKFYNGEKSMASRSEMNKKPQSDKLIAKRRKCLMCMDEFQSSHIGERVCPDCKGTSTWRQTGIAI
tara:strand:- start:6676 stop:6933 length:258 start_codon:yes stop_codon:yes gene_type:complete